ncbi:unnamed protein product [Ectocarpus sp. 4 AP-2014]
MRGEEDDLHTCNAYGTFWAAAGSNCYGNCARKTYKNSRRLAFSEHVPKTYFVVAGQRVQRRIPKLALIGTAEVAGIRPFLAVVFFYDIFLFSFSKKDNWP